MDKTEEDFREELKKNLLLVADGLPLKFWPKEFKLALFHARRRHEQAAVEYLSKLPRK